MKKQEANKTPEVMKAFSLLVPKSAPFEVKHTRGKDYFLMSELKEHQINWLMACGTKKGCTWKIPDAGFSFNPFDCLHYKNNKAYVVIVYTRMAYVIEIHDLIKFKGTKLNEEEAFNLSSYIL